MARKISFPLSGVFLFLFLNGVAQTKSPALPENLSSSGSTAFYFLDGFQFFHFKNLNQQLSAFGYPEIKNSQSILGFGGFGTIGRLVLGAEGGNFYSKAQNDSVICKAEGTTGMLYCGYKVIAIPHVDIYPLAGVGFGGVNVTLQQQQPDRSFSNFLSSPFNAGRMGQSQVFFNLSAAADLRVREKNSLFIGLRGGYNFAGTTDWKADNFYFVNAPRDKFENYYFQLILGISIGS